MNRIANPIRLPGSLWSLLVGLLLVLGLVLTYLHAEYVLFHSLVEIFSIVVAFGIFTVFWNSRRFLDNGCFLFLGIAYLFVGGIDLLHTLAYKGMEVFEGGGSNLATQLWIATRYVESLSILAAPMFLRRRLNPYVVLAGYVVVVSLLLGSIFYWKVFPACYLGKLTPFKIASEYLICVILIAALVLFYRRRAELDARVFQLLFLSIVLTIAAEMVFTGYKTVTGLVNMSGHFLKLGSFYLIYVAFVEVALKNPYAILFRNLKESEESLRRSEGRFRGTFDSAAVGMAHVDLDGRWLLVNQRLCEIVGYPREELLKKSLQDFIHPDDRSHDLAQFHALARDETANYSREERYLHRDGRVVWVMLTMALQRDASGDPLYMIAAVQDITKRREVEQQLKAINETLEQRVAERASLAEQRAAQLRALASELTLTEQRERRRLAQIIHDHLQQILVTAKLKVGVLRRRDESDDQPFQSLDELLDQAIGASRSLTVELSPPVLYESGLAAGLKWLARHKQEKHGLGVEVEIDPEAEPQAEDQRVLIFQAVRELLFNVVKHARVGSARVEMSRTEEDEVRVTVSDVGVGFDPDKLQTEVGSQAGFGLFSVRERLGLVGGRLEIDAAPGRGTRVSVVVPLAQPEQLGGGARRARASSSAPGSRVESGPAGGDGVAGGTRPIRVLLADDHQLLREGLASLLGDQPDIEVVGEASDGQAAFDLALLIRPDVVLMDVSMPRLNGIEATRRITAVFPEIRVIGLSMHEEADMAEAMRRAGAVEYFPKDGLAEQLVAAIRQTASTARSGHGHSHP
jgi:PAS domain S-box-containing protein